MSAPLHGVGVPIDLSAEKRIGSGPMIFWLIALGGFYNPIVWAFVMLRIAKWFYLTTLLPEGISDAERFRLVVGAILLKSVVTSGLALRREPRTGPEPHFVPSDVFAHLAAPWMLLVSSKLLSWVIP